MLQITTPNRPDIREAGVLVHGAYLERYQTRGLQVVGVVEYRDGTREVRPFDEVAGWDPDHDLGGWKPSDRAFGAVVLAAAAWLREELVPPCDPAVA